MKKNSNIYLLYGEEKYDLEKKLSSIKKQFDKLENGVNLFYITKDNIDELVRVLEKEDKRAKFEISYKKFCSSVEMLMPNHVGTDILNDVRWLGYIKAAAKAKYAPQTELDVSDAGEKVRTIIEQHLKSDSINNSGTNENSYRCKAPPI